MCEAYLFYPKKEKDSLCTQAREEGQKDTERDRDRESETACTYEGQKSIAGIFLSGSQA